MVRRKHWLKNDFTYSEKVETKACYKPKMSNFKAFGYGAFIFFNLGCLVYIFVPQYGYIFLMAQWPLMFLFILKE